MKFPNAKIIVFAKAPVAGHCKTRLIPALGEQGAAALHAELVHHTLNTVTQAALSPVELWCADSTDHPFIAECSQRYPITLKQQHGEDLGKRMENAFRDVLDNHTFAIIIGTDCPSLTEHDLEEAMQALQADHLCTLHPAHDGGYVALGLRQVDSHLFCNIRWGSSSVFSETQQRLEQLNWIWKELRTHDDIDRPEDLVNLPSNLTKLFKKTS